MTNIGIDNENNSLLSGYNIISNLDTNIILTKASLCDTFSKSVIKH